MYNSQTVTTHNMLSTTFFYRGTGSITKALNANNDTYNVTYFPMWGINHRYYTGWNAVMGCSSKDYFVTYTIPTPYANETAMRIGFQSTASTENTKKMVLYHTQWLS